MSRTSKLTLAATSLFAASTVFIVHFQQKFEKESCRRDVQNCAFRTEANCKFATQAMHEGVVRDMEQQRVKRERQLDFDMQKALEEEYKREQSVSGSIVTGDKAVPNS
ncbi:hypothetical protein AK830_g8813 [Neonectria ditissima]|uniref:Cytochrome c oxidase assembly protein n=1 Tax=Neonectria ditissima TaxID=78410 RepID=A0A0P7BBD1_9HYPO|nr:hypothetical protein AK830_g8813 [Neonectria ditissima]